jgi:hypothetical protein
MKISSEQVRAARALLRWEQRDLADASKVSLPSIKRLETTPGPLAAQPRTIDAIRGALEGAGVEFTNGRNPGVSLKATRIAMRESAFLEGLEKFNPILRGNVQFDGLRVVRDKPTLSGPTSIKLITTDGDVIGNASQYHGLAYFDPPVAQEGVSDTMAEVIFADWAGAAIRRAKQGK